MFDGAESIFHLMKQAFFFHACHLNLLTRGLSVETSNSKSF